METTFEKFIANDPKEKAKFDKEYEKFLLSEFVIEKMEEENLSIRGLAQKAKVSPTIIQKIRNTKTADRISFRTLVNVIDSLGYRISFVRC